MKIAHLQTPSWQDPVGGLVIQKMDSSQQKQGSTESKTYIGHQGWPFKVIVNILN